MTRLDRSRRDEASLRPLVVALVASLAVGLAATGAVAVVAGGPSAASPGDDVLGVTTDASGITNVSDEHMERAVTAACSASPTTVAPGETVTLDATASTDATAVEFDEQGDGTYDTWDEVDYVINVTYADPGTYEPTVRAYNGSDTDTATCGTVTVSDNQAPSAAFDHAPTEPTQGESVTFDATESSDADGQIVAYYWDFDGDGTTDETTGNETVSHAFATVGWKTVELVVEDDDGARATTTRDVYVAEPAPAASCTADPTTVRPGAEVTLDASASSNASTVEFDADGDGAYERSDETDFEITVTYETDGTYEPVARARRGDQQDMAPCGTVTVSRDENSPPSASFAVSPNPSSPNSAVTFDASNATDADGRIAEYRWDFDGDGTTDETTGNATTTYTYGSTGDRVVSLVVVDDDGATASTSRDVRIEQSDRTQVRCTASPTSVEPGEAVTLDASETSGADVLEFDVDGDGEYERQTSSKRTITVTYDDAGTYAPVVRASNFGSGDDRPTDECGTVTVGENEPPEPALTHRPIPVVAGESVTFDASNSSDADGRIVEYRWDVDDDGTFEETTTVAELDWTYAASDAPQGVVDLVLEVVDDDGATAEMRYVVDVVEPRGGAACSVEPTTATPGEAVTIDASNSSNVVYVQFDVDGDGEFERADETDFAETVAYDELGTYPIVVRTTTADGGASTAECGPVTVVPVNAPPDAIATQSPSVARPGVPVQVDASNSTDVDGRIVEYRWDLDADGSFEATTSRPWVNHSFANPGNYSVRVVVVDDAGASDATVVRVPVREPTEGGVPLWPAVPAGLAGGGAAGYGLCRARRRWGSGGGSASTIRHVPRPSGLLGGGGTGILGQATGTFATPKDSETVAVGGLGFEPDVLVFTATSNASDSGRPDDAAGWSYGKAMVDDEATISQNAVTVVDDATTIGAGTCGVADDASIDVRSSDDPGDDGVVGRVEATTQDGFEVAFDVPADATPSTYEVLFQAFELADDADVAVGHVPVPDEPTTQSIPTGFTANHAVVTATTATDPVGTQASRSTDELGVQDEASRDAISVSHGEAVVDDGGVEQRVVSSGVDARRASRNEYAASAERVVHLLGGSDDPAARTAASVTTLDGGLELSYEEVATDGMVTFLAVDAGDEGRPAIGRFDLPSPEGDDVLSVDVGFEPGLVEFTACNVDAVAGNRSIGESPLAFGWSHGSVMVGDGVVHQHMLHGAFDAADSSRPAPSASDLDAHPTAAAAARTPGAGPIVDDRVAGRDRSAASPGRGRPDGGSEVGEHSAATETASSGDDTASSGTRSAYGGSSDAVAAALIVGADGTILGRDEVRVTGTTATGFEVDVSDVSTRARDAASERRPVVFYKAWPHPGDAK